MIRTAPANEVGQTTTPVLSPPLEEGWGEWGYDTAMGPLCTLAIKQQLKYVQEEWLL